jgi:hypothetical protein
MAIREEISPPPSEMEPFRKIHPRRFHMRKSKFSDIQIIAILKQAQTDTPVPELCREHGMTVLGSTTGAQILAAWMTP